MRASAANDPNGINESVTLTHTPSGADYGGGTTARIVVTATDDDAPSLRVAPTSLTLAEGASAVYTVRLNAQPAAQVTVTVGGATAAVAVDTAAAPGVQTTMTFSNSTWSTPQTVTVSAPTDDDAVNATTTLTHAVAGTGGYASLGPGARPGVAVTVNDGDEQGLVIDADPSTGDADAGPLAVDENDSAEYAVRLATRPTDTVTVTATSPDPTLAVDADASPQTRTLTFTTSTWNAAQTVTARALDDLDGGDETTTIAHAAMGGDYGGGVSATLSVAVADDDPRLVALAATSTLAGLDEDDSATYTVALSTRPTGPVTVAISGSDASAATVDADDAVGGPQGAVTFTASTWDTARTVTVSALDDDDGFDETITLTHDPSGADYGLAPNATFAFTLDDDDPRGVVLSTSTLMVQENGSATYTVKLRAQPSGGAVTVAIASGGGGIAVAPTSLTFNGANWNTPRQVRASAAEDGNSVHESVVVRHTPSGADYGGVPPADLTATAVDNDRPGLRVSPTRLAVDENQSAEYAVRLNTDPLGSVTVTATSDDAAVALDADSTPQARTLTFDSSSWDTPQTVTATAVEDDNATDETATVTHAASGVSAYTGLVGAALPSVQVAVDDNDARALVIDADPSTDDVDAGPLAATENQSAEYTVRLATQPTGTVTVTATSPDPALAVDSDASPRTRTLTFTTNTWDTAQTVTARALDDLDGGDETTTIAHAADGADYDDVSASLAAETADDDPRRVLAGSPIALGEGGMASSTARLATQPTGTVTVAITDDHPDVTVAPPTTLTFDAATWQTAQTFTIRAGEDLDGEDETATLTFDPRGADYDGAPSATSTVNLTDDETRGVTLSESTLAVPEGGSATYTVRLDTRPFGGTVTVTVGGTGSGISASPTALTFTGTNWNAPRTVRVSAAEDDNPTHESVDLTHTVAGADYGREGVAAGTVRATATDNDTPSLRVAPTALALVEEGADGFYAVRLNTPPSGDVAVTVGGATSAVAVDTDGGTPGSQSTLTFTTTDWATAQTVTVSAPADDDAANATTTLTHAATGPGDYASLGPEARPGVNVAVDDDDERDILIDADPATSDLDAGPLALNEQPGHADNAKQYAVRLATEPTGTVSVVVASGDRAVTVDNDATPRTRTLTFTTTNWSAAQTVTATAAQDDDASPERVAIAHEASGGDYGDVSATLTATTADDDAPALLLATSTLAASGVAEGGTQTYTVRLATEPSGTVTVAATATATATARVEVDMDGGQAGAQSSLRFDAANWSAPRTATVRGLEDDDAADGMATLRHSASGADYGGVEAADETFAVADDDTPALLASATAVTVNEGSTAAYTVRLATRPVGGTVTVAATSTNAAAATVQPAQVRFGAGDWDAPKTFRVHGAQAGSATISHSASGADYDGAAATTVAATVRDTQAPGVRIEPPTLALREGESGVYAVRLNTDPGGTATVTATSGSALVEIDRDATPLARELTFTTDNWRTAQTVTATALADDGVGDETATVTHAVSGYAGVASAPSLTVRVADDDAPGLLFEPAEGLRLEESGAAGTYAVRLRFAPSAPVAVAVSSDDAGVTVDTNVLAGIQDTLTFNATNWSTAQTATVRAVPDADAASETATLLHAAAGAGSGYEGVTAAYAVRVSDANAAPAPTGVAASAAGPTSLAVRWTPSAGAEGHAVQWRRAGQAWSAARQLALPGDASSARIDGLATGAEYEVRVLGLNRGDPGDPSSSARATPRALGPGNRAPVAVASFADRTLILGAAQALDLSGVFRDPDGDALVYTARSLNPSAVEASVSGSELRLRAAGIGLATIYVYATDPGGLVGSQTLRARVARSAALSADDAQAPEGGAAQLVLRLSPARSTSTRIVWSLALDADAATADADDLVETSGEATIPAGETRIEIAVAIADDDDIEPAREWFEVSLSAPDGCCGPAARARVTVLEGVCDRTPAVRDALRGSDSCAAPTPAMLAAIERLELSGAGAGSLRADDFAGLSGLRALLLDGNGLETLPDGLFAGLSGLRELSLEDNPEPVRNSVFGGGRKMSPNGGRRYGKTSEREGPDQRRAAGRAAGGRGSGGGVPQRRVAVGDEEGGGGAGAERGDGPPSVAGAGGRVGQPPQRPQPQAGGDGERVAGAGGAARPARELRAGAGGEVRPAAAGLRREGDLDVRARHDDARDRGARGGAVRAVGVAGAGLEGDGRGSRGDSAVAVEAAGADVRDRLLRRGAGEDPRRGAGSEQGGASGDRRDLRGAQGGAGDVAGARGGREVLAVGDERARGARRPGRADRGGGRPERLPGGDRGGLPGRRGADLHRASHALFAGARRLEGTQGTGRGDPPDLPGADRRGGGSGAGRLRGRAVEREVPRHRQKLAGGVGSGGAVLRVLGGDPAGDLHDQRDREPELHGAPGGAGARPLPQRPGRRQAGVPGAAQRRREVAQSAAVLARRARRVRHPLRRALPAGGAVGSDSEAPAAFSGALPRTPKYMGVSATGAACLAAGRLRLAPTHGLSASGVRGSDPTAIRHARGSALFGKDRYSRIEIFFRRCRLPCCWRAVSVLQSVAPTHGISDTPTIRARRSRWRWSWRERTRPPGRRGRRRCRRGSPRARRSRCARS